MRRYYKYKMNMIIGNIVAIIFLFLSCLPVKDMLITYINKLDYKMLSIILMLYVFWILLHEALHGIGHIINGVRRDELSFGANIEKGVLFCLVRREVGKKDILISLLFPFFFIGVVTYVIGIIINSPILVILSIFNISGASIDLLMLFNFIKLGKDITYIEPTDGTSFYLMSNSPIKKLFGLSLVEEGIYDKKMFKNLNFKKFDISKLSYIFFIILILLILILNFL